MATSMTRARTPLQQQAEGQGASKRRLYDCGLTATAQTGKAVYLSLRFLPIRNLAVASSDTGHNRSNHLDRCWVPTISRSISTAGASPTNSSMDFIFASSVSMTFQAHSAAAVYSEKLAGLLKYNTKLRLRLKYNHKETPSLAKKTSVCYDSMQAAEQQPHHGAFLLLIIASPPFASCLLFR